MPSDVFLTLVKDQNWTGCKRIRFYETERVIEILKKDLNDPKASSKKMFGCAMRKVNSCENSRGMRVSFLQWMDILASHHNSSDNLME